MAANQDGDDRSISSSPPNFSWIVEDKLAGMGWPRSPENMNYLLRHRISHLITLSPEKLPPYLPTLEMTWSIIPIQEFDAPTLQQIEEFINLCHTFNFQNKAVGIHCRQGRGRTGVMAACYLVYFHDLTPQRAIINLRLLRPGSVETYRQEKIVEEYYDHLRRNQ